MRYDYVRKISFAVMIAGMSLYANGSLAAELSLRNVEEFSENMSGYSNMSLWRYGGAIETYGTIGRISADFTDNEARQGGAIFVHNKSKIGEVSGNFISNMAAKTGGAIYITSDHWFVSDGSNIDGNFSDNKVVASGNYTASGGAISLYSDVPNSVFGVFSNNVAQSEREAFGGALSIYSWVHDIAEEPASLSGLSTALSARHGD